MEEGIPDFYSVERAVALRGRNTPYVGMLNRERYNIMYIKNDRDVTPNNILDGIRVIDEPDSVIDAKITTVRS
tara:strand:- start:5199 stop:5417 length:219 start_codon:yes stop_codon:yes gene_type:complete